MSICGYNDKIGEGLRILVDGMVEALEKKARNASVMEVLDREMVELETMIGTMQKAQGATLPEMFIGLNIMAKALFARVRMNLRSSNSDDLGAECRAIGDAFIELLSSTEKRNEQQLAQKGDSIRADILAKQLAEWVLDQPPTEPKKEIPGEFAESVGLI